MVAGEPTPRSFWVKMGFQPDLSDLGLQDAPIGSMLVHLGVQDGVLTRDQWGDQTYVQ
jgi:hypothetical protein